MTLKLADAYPSERKAQQELHLHKHLHMEEERRLMDELIKEPREVLLFFKEHLRWPTEEERRKLIGEGSE